MRIDRRFDLEVKEHRGILLTPKLAIALSERRTGTTYDPKRLNGSFRGTAKTWRQQQATCLGRIQGYSD